MGIAYEHEEIQKTNNVLFINGSTSDELERIYIKC